MVAFRDISIGSPIALVVESDQALRRLTCTILRQNGYQVHASSHGVNVWEIEGGEASIHVLVVGMNLASGQSGLLVAKQIWDKNPAVRIIITGASSPDEAEMNIVRRAGMTFLSLPYSFGRLSQAAAAQSERVALA